MVRLEGIEEDGDSTREHKIQTRGRKRCFMVREMTFNELEEGSIGAGPGTDGFVGGVIGWAVGKVLDWVVTGLQQPQVGCVSTHSGPACPRK